MKKRLLTGVILLLMSAGLFAQAVKDRNIIPVAVNLNQVLRMTVTNGGNIEFNFNTIDAYASGLSGDVATSSSANTAATEGIYQTDFTVSSSTRWKITYGAEDATFIGVDNPANTLALNNVGLGIAATGTHTFETGVAQGTTDAEQLWSTPTAAATTPTALQIYPVDLIEDNDSPTDANAGDATDNAFTIDWRCGTSEGTVNAMNTASLLDQDPSPTPDRYVVNVIFELAVD